MLFPTIKNISRNISATEIFRSDNIECERIGNSACTKGSLHDNFIACRYYPVPGSQ